jgi:hypothetical protein
MLQCPRRGTGSRTALQSSERAQPMKKIINESLAAMTSTCMCDEARLKWAFELVAARRSPSGMKAGCDRTSDDRNMLESVSNAAAHRSAVRAGNATTKVLQCTLPSAHRFEGNWKFIKQWVIIHYIHMTSLPYDAFSSHPSMACL